jgi:hypothetical protein
VPRALVFIYTMRTRGGSGLVEFDRENDAVHLSPTGAREVETKILKVPLSGENGPGPE